MAYVEPLEPHLAQSSSSVNLSASALSPKVGWGKECDWPRERHFQEVESSEIQEDFTKLCKNSVSS